MKIRRLEGRLKRSHLVYNASQRPDIALHVIRQILPHLRTGVIRRACLSIRQALLEYFRDIQIPEFIRAFLVNEDIRGLEIAMEYLLIVQGLEPPSYVDQRLPNLVLPDPGLCLEILVDDAHEVASLRELKHDAEIARPIVVEGLLEADDVLVVERGEDSYLVEGVFFLLLLHARHLHLLQRVDLVIEFSAHLVHLAERALAYLL